MFPGTWSGTAAANGQGIAGEREHRWDIWMFSFLGCADLFISTRAPDGQRPALLSATFCTSRVISHVWLVEQMRGRGGCSLAFLQRVPYPLFTGETVSSDLFSGVEGMFP